MLQVKNITKCYKMGTTTVNALNGVSLHIKKNEFVAVMGSSGSGKSTLMNILGCLDTPTDGDYILNGKEVSRMNDDELASVRNIHLGFVFQSFHLLPRLTALKNVALPLIYTFDKEEKTKRLERARVLLEKVGLGERVDHKPSELSGGERQRVAIARALINNPDILLADEPTGNLDSTTAVEIMELFKKLHSQDQTIIMVTHEHSIAAYAHRTITLKDGRIINDSKKS